MTRFFFTCLLVVATAHAAESSEPIDDKCKGPLARLASAILSKVIGSNSDTKEMQPKGPKFKAGTANPIIGNQYWLYTPEEIEKLERAVEWAKEQGLTHRPALWEAARLNSPHAMPLIIAAEFAPQSRRLAIARHYAFDIRAPRAVLTDEVLQNADYQIIHALVSNMADAPNSYLEQDPGLFLAGLKSGSYDLPPTNSFPRFRPLLERAAALGYNFEREMAFMLEQEAMFDLAVAAIEKDPKTYSEAKMNQLLLVAAGGKTSERYFEYFAKHHRKFITTNQILRLIRNGATNALRAILENIPLAAGDGHKLMDEAIDARKLECVQLLLKYIHREETNASINRWVKIAFNQLQADRSNLPPESAKKSSAVLEALGAARDAIEAEGKAD